MKEPTENEIAAALVSVSLASGLPLIEATIGPVEVYADQVTMPRSVWLDTCRRAIDGERNVKHLQERCDGLYLQIEAHEVVGAAKDADYEALEKRCERLQNERDVFIATACLMGLALTGLICAVMWRLG